MDEYLSRIEEYVGRETFNSRMLKSSMYIRTYLQELIDNRKNMKKEINNFYMGNEKIPYTNVLDTVYIKGGMIVDWLTSPRDMRIKDLDYSVSISSEDVMVKDLPHIHNKIGARIQKLLEWLITEQTKTMASDLLDALFDKYEEIEIYNAYDSTKQSYVYKKNSTVLVLPHKYVSHYEVNLNDDTILHRYYYSMYMKDKTNNYEIKLNIVDLSVEKNADYKIKSNLVQRFIDSRTYIITQSLLALLNDQLITLLYSAVTLNVKYEKRKKRIYNILLELENSEIKKSNINIIKNKQLKQINKPFDVIYFSRYLCSNGVNLKEWIIRVVEDQHIDNKESQTRVCEMLEEVMPRVIRRLKI